jgi:deazaflavin-dependent oxidoreductase (nitroreductase family)
LSGGRTSLASFISGIPVVLLTTTGRHSGLPRTTPVLCVMDQANPNRFAVIVSNFGQKHLPAWYYNLKNNPHAKATVSGQTRVYIVHEASDAEYSGLWQAAIDIYPAYQVYRQRARRHVPILVLEAVE